jgi:acyl carrier protein
MNAPLTAICDDLLQVLRERLRGGGPIDAETDLVEGDLLDSLGVMALVAAVEKRYGVRLENADIAPRNFRTAAALAALVAQRLAQG